MTQWFERARRCATEGDVKQAIDEMVAYCLTLSGQPNPEFGFAHVVLMDYNLSDGFIDDCLSSEAINDFLGSRITDFVAAGGERMDIAGQISGLLESVSVTIDFLCGLRYVPESVREAVNAG